jgi:thymidylate synthase (FAD)
MKGSVRSWIHYFSARCDPHTQKEHRLIAKEIRDLFTKRFPQISAALSYDLAPQ